MANLQTYRADDNDWATHVEMVVNEPEAGREEGIELLTQTENPIRFVLATISTPEGLVPHELDAGVLILDRNGRSIPPSGAPGSNFIAPGKLMIFNTPEDRTWQISTYGSIPYAVSAMAFHPAAAILSLRAGASLPAAPLKCRVCKSTAKALALAIVAVATYPAIPAALIAAVASFLGVAALAAAAFINSVLGDVVSVIAEKLCRTAGLCP
jgi:hypothetical protein